MFWKKIKLQKVVKKKAKKNFQCKIIHDAQSFVREQTSLYVYVQIKGTVKDEKGRK